MSSAEEWLPAVPIAPKLQEHIFANPAKEWEATSNGNR
jgi:hypothetical protein